MIVKHAFCDKKIEITPLANKYIMIEFEENYIVIERDVLLTVIGELNLRNLIELNDKFKFLENKLN